MAPTEGGVARPERRWGCRRGTLYMITRKNMWPPDSWMYRVHQKKVINISATVAIFVAKLIVLTEEDSDHTFCKFH